MTQLAKGSQSAAEISDYQERMADFIRYRTSVERGKNRCSTFALAHMGDEGEKVVTEDTIDLKLPEAQLGAARDALSEAFWSEAVSYASTLPGRQRFLISAYNSDKEGANPKGTHVIIVDPPPVAAALHRDAISGSDKMSMEILQGLVGGMFEQFRMGVAQNQDRMMAMNDQLLARNLVLEQNSQKQAELYQQAMDNGLMRQITMRKEMVAIERDERLYKALEGLAKKWLSTQMGGDHPVMAFIQKLPPEKGMRLMQSLEQTLSPEEAAELAAILKGEADLKG